MLTRDDARRLLLVLLLVWLATLAVLTRGRVRVFESELTLWTSAVRVTPHKPRPWINLGLARETAGDWRGALAAQQTAFVESFQPRLTRYQAAFSQIASQINIARILALSGHEDAAERLLDELVTRTPRFAALRWNRGVLYARTGRCVQAQAEWRVAAALDRSFQVEAC